MSADRRRRDKNEAAEGLTDLPPAASLLSVPIFRAAARQQAARRSAHRPASEPAPPSVPDADGRSTAAQVGLKAASAPATNAAPYTVVGGTDGGAQTQGEPPATRWTPALKPVDGRQSYPTLLAYWRTLARQGRAPIEKLDAEMIAECWPYAMLIRVPRDGVVDITHVFAPESAAANASGEPAPQHPFARDQASQISSWLLEIAQDAAGTRQPSRHSETFQQAGRSRRITADLLPCQADGDAADHLLLQLRDG